MRIYRYGITRYVVEIGAHVIKFPQFRYGQRNFVLGMLGNMTEAMHWTWWRHDQLAPVYHCGPLGLWLVMKRYQVLNRRLASWEIAALPFDGFDNNGYNAALDDGRIVVIDYGNADFFLKAT